MAFLALILIAASLSNSWGQAKRDRRRLRQVEVITDPQRRGWFH